MHQLHQAGPSGDLFAEEAGGEKPTQPAQRLVEKSVAGRA
jgi:hypothetical protein